MSSGAQADATEAGPQRHVPALLGEALKALVVRPGGVYLDATFGGGGYSRALLAEGADVIAIDRDPEAIAAGVPLADASGGRLRLVRGRFADLDRLASAHGFAALDGVVFDIGVSSMQFDDARRGFSFRADAALDMRMEKEGRSAADILASADEATLADILYHYGEERAARRIACAIVNRRKDSPLATTRQLAALVAEIAPGRPGDAIHPATRVFQALRIAVNDELTELAEGLAAAERALKPGGRLVVVAFHSLEDRIVKTFLALRSGRGAAPSRRLPGEKEPEAPTFRLFPGQPIAPSAQETRANPRARSAKLRYAERTAAPSRPLEAAILALAQPTPNLRGPL